MRLTDLFTRTLRDAPADAELISHRLAVRAGLIRPIAAGSLALMPLGWRVMERLMTILRQEMDALGAQEVRLPLMQPAEIWQASGRWESFGPVLQRFESEAGRAFALGPTHEELVAMLAAREIDSYRQLPQLLYQIQTKYRNEPRPRGGLIRLREFTMKDAYSLDASAEGMRAQYERMVAAYRRIFARVELDVVVAEADSGAMGGAVSQEFLLPHPQGEDSFVACPACGYAANLEAATFRLTTPELAPLEPVRKVATPGCTTIQQVAAFLGVPEAQTLKAVFFIHTPPGDAERFVFVVIRGDLEVNETKLLRALGGGTLRPAEDAEIRAIGAVPGYASPLGLREGVLVVADQSVGAGANFVAGANDDGHHLTGVNIPRDFVPALLADVALAFDGAACPRCAEGTLRLGRAIELGHCFALGTFYSEALGVHYLDERGVTQPVWMGSYGIGLERLMAAIIETHHDDYGICWPAAVAPFDAHIVTLGGDEETLTTAQAVYHGLREAGFAVLLDDRNESAGVKFADADLIGAPVRFTVSKKALAAGGVEAKRRTAPERAIVPLTALPDWLRGVLT